MPSIREGLMLGIGLAISFIVIAALFPTAIGDIASVTTDPNTSDPNVSAESSNWTGLAVTFWNLMQFGIPLAAFLFVVGWALDVF